MGTILWGIIVFFGLDIKNVESRRSNISACLNPKTSTKHSGMTCSGDGECKKTWKRCKGCEPFFCQCYAVEDDFIDGELQLYYTRHFGKWCQCNPKDCITPWKNTFGKVEFFWNESQFGRF